MIYIVVDLHPFVRVLSKDSYENSLNAQHGLSQQERVRGVRPGLTSTTQTRRKWRNAVGALCKADSLEHTQGYGMRK